RVLAFTLAATGIAALLAGLAPGFQASKRDIAADFRGDPSASRGWTLRDGLVAGQMAITALLLIVAALLMRSLAAVERTNPGFAVNRLAIVSTDTSMAAYGASRSSKDAPSRRAIVSTRRAWRW